MAVSFLQQLGFDDKDNTIWDATADRVLVSTGWPVEASGVSYRNDGRTNARAFNRALARGGLITNMTPGQYIIGGDPETGGMIGNSNVTLLSGEGVEYILADQTFRPLFSNARAFATPITLTGVSILWVGPSFRCQIIWPEIDVAYPAGSKFAVLGLLGSTAANRGYQGIWQVTDTVPGSIFFNLMGQPPSGGNSATGATIYPVDSTIKIIGGMWDGNEAGQSGTPYVDGDPYSSILSFRNTQNLIVSGVQFRKGAAWCIGTNNVRDVTVRDVDANTYSGVGVAGAHDIVHLAGGARNVLIERVTADCDDNTVGMTLDDIVNSVAVPIPYAARYWPGDTYDITIRDISSRDSNAATVALWGNNNYEHHNTLIERITGRATNGGVVQVLAGYAPTNMLNVNGGRLVLRDISGPVGGSVVNFSSDGVWNDIIIENLSNTGSGPGQPVLLVNRVTTAQSIKSFKASNISQFIDGGPLQRTGPLVRVTDSNVEDFRLEGSPTQRVQANVSFVVFSGTTGTINRAVVEGFSGVSNSTTIPAGTSDTFIVSCENTNATALGNLAIRDSAMVGGTALAVNTGGIFRQSTTGRVTNVLIENSQQTGGEGVSVVDNGVNPATVTIR